MHAMLRGGEGENMILKKANFVTKLIISKHSLLPKYVNTYKEILYITPHCGTIHLDWFLVFNATFNNISVIS